LIRQDLPANRAVPADFFSGGGEMGALIRSIDWTKSRLGAIESWPNTLRTAVGICLGSRHPIVLWWGPERTMFYNDAYRPMLGESKHPQFFGGSGIECWAEIWDVIGPMMDQVIETGEATWSEDLFLLMFRYGYLEETYFTFSYSPIPDESGRPGGIFNACAESTGRVLGERRMKTLREMAIEARTANEAARICAEILGHNPHDIPFALVYLLDKTGRQLQLAGHAGLEPGTPASPISVEIAEPDTAGWPLGRVAANGRPELVEDLTPWFDYLPKQPWDEPAHQAMILPISHPGRRRPTGVLALGISPRRAFDDSYQGFFKLVAGHVATAVANARAYEEERERAERLAELDRAKTIFFSNISHELRTPLTLMIGPLEETLARTEGVLPGEDHENLIVARRNGLRLLKLVNTLLDFSRIEAGRTHAVYKPTDLATLTASLAGVFRSAIEKAGIELIVDCPPLAEPVYIDADMWEKIVLNLLSNAFKFTLKGWIRVRLRSAGDHVELSIEDTGCGIPEPELCNVFKRFYRIEQTEGRTYEGTGIGLSLVEELVKFHGGTVSVASTPGKGSKFTVSLPFGKEHLSAEQIGAGQTLTSTSIGAGAFVEEALRWLPGEDEIVSVFDAQTVLEGQKPRVLLADDNADMREYVRKLLRAHYEIVAVPDGEAAWTAISEQHPDLVLTDIMMPKLDGFGLLARLRENEVTRSIPVILLSARAGEESQVEGLDAGADDYLVKPFGARELLAHVRANLNMARIRQESARFEERLKAEERTAEKLREQAQLLELRFREQTAELQRSNQALQDFAAIASHDLQEPLRKVALFGDMLKQKWSDSLGEQGIGYLDRVLDANQRMQSLLTALLEYSRISTKANPFVDVELTKVVHEVLSDLEARIQRTGGEVHVGELPVIQSDPTQMRQLFQNLVGNALKFHKEGEKPIVKVSCVRANNGVAQIIVEDNGIGFDEKHLERIFAPFQRLHGRSEYEGTGMGLAICKKIVERHGGSITAKSAPGAGATFIIELPLAQNVGSGM